MLRLDCSPSFTCPRCNRDARRLAIEVEASERCISRAIVHLTRNEWETAGESRHHAFHLWDVSGGRSKPAVITVAEAASHVPVDSGDGFWESVVVPFSAFAKLFTEH
jgi:hypothetical protein